MNVNTNTATTNVNENSVTMNDNVNATTKDATVVAADQTTRHQEDVGTHQGRHRRENRMYAHFVVKSINREQTIVVT